MPSVSQVIIVTGASRGIGKSIVELLLKAKEQPKVVGVSRSEAALKDLQSQYPDRFAYVTGDVAEEETSKAVIKKALDTFGHVHGIILNAGVLEPVAPVAEADVNAWRRLYEINFFAPLTLVSHAIPHLRLTSGRVVFVSSGASVSNYSGWAAYGSSKAALNHLAGSIAAEEANIFAVSIAPGVVDTSMQVNIRENFGKGMSKQQHDKFIRLKSDGALLPPEVPGEIIANLALRGQGDDLNGKYLRYNDPSLTSYKS